MHVQAAKVHAQPSQQAAKGHAQLSQQAPHTQHMSAAHQQGQPQQVAARCEDRSWQRQLLDWTYTKPWEPTDTLRSSHRHTAQPCTSQVAATCSVCSDQQPAGLLQSSVTADVAAEAPNSVKLQPSETARAGRWHSHQDPVTADIAAEALNVQWLPHETVRAQQPPSESPSCGSASPPDASDPTCIPCPASVLGRADSAAQAPQTQPHSVGSESRVSRVASSAGSTVHLHPCRPGLPDTAHMGGDANSAGHKSHANAQIKDSQSAARELQSRAASTMQQHSPAPKSTDSAEREWRCENSCVSAGTCQSQAVGRADSWGEPSTSWQDESGLSRDTDARETVYATPDSVMKPLDLPSPSADESSSEGQDCNNAVLQSLIHVNNVLHRPCLVWSRFPQMPSMQHTHSHWQTHVYCIALSNASAVLPLL